MDSAPVSSTPTSVTPQTMNPTASSFTPQGLGMCQTEPEGRVVSSNTAIQLKSNPLLMTCRVLVYAPDGTHIEARALLDNASSASFVSERLAQTLNLLELTRKLGYQEWLA